MTDLNERIAKLEAIHKPDEIYSCDSDIAAVILMAAQSLPDAMAIIRELVVENERLRGIIEFNGFKGEL